MNGTTEPALTTGMIATVANITGRESKAEVLVRAELRMTQHMNRYGIDASLFKMLDFYEARYQIAPGEEASLIAFQRCLNREGDSPACRLHVSHKGDCDWMTTTNTTTEEAP